VTDNWPRLFSRPFYPIIDTDACREYGREPLAVTDACLRGGARVLQLRGKGASGASYLQLADAMVSAAREYDAAIIVNDRADVAAMARAAGVHVGQDDLPVLDVRRIVGARAIVGLSTHDQHQVDAALHADTDYIAVGPIYGTSTKETGYSARGLDLVRYAAGRGKPVVAIGGITLARAPEVIAAGAAAVVVISDLLHDDPERRTRQFIDLLHV
jgi:thiamine-phosphate pyrophosphorylase